MANITPKSNGTYLIRISCGSDAAGKPISKSKIFKPSKPNLSYQKLNKEIDAFVKAFEEEIELYGIQQRPDRIRFAEFCEKYLEVKKSTLAPTTYPFYENVVKEMLIFKFQLVYFPYFYDDKVQKNAPIWCIVATKRCIVISQDILEIEKYQPKTRDICRFQAIFAFICPNLIIGVVEAASSSLVTQTSYSLENIEFSRLFLILSTYDLGDFLKISKK